MPQAVLGGGGELVGLHLVRDVRVGRGRVPAHRAALERTDRGGDLRIVGDRGHDLVDRRLIRRRGDPPTARGDEYDPGERAVGGHIREALVQEILRLLRLRARHGQTVVAGGRRERTPLSCRCRQTNY